MNRLTILQVLRATAEDAGYPIEAEPTPELEAAMEAQVVATVEYLEELQGLNPLLPVPEREEVATAWLVEEWRTTVLAMMGGRQTAK